MTNDTTSSHQVGGKLLELITNGMYKTPLAIYREYLQNSLDAYEMFEKFTGKRSVSIRINHTDSTICIRDNGPGLGPKDAIRELIPIASSQKKFGKFRGFRGIGRLSALAFAEEICFRTRSSEDQPITEVTWKKQRLNGENQKISFGDLLNKVVVVERRIDNEESGHFFEVNIRGINLQAANPLLNTTKVKSYIAETCPVPLGKNFQYTGEIEAAVPTTSPDRNLSVIVGNDDTEIQRPHSSRVLVSGEKVSEYNDLEIFRIENIDGTEYSAIGWIAHTDYCGAIVGSREIRGIRARHGNIQIGGEDVFSHLFREERFVKWCIGEVHMIGDGIRPNATRDYFEVNAELKNLENYIGSIAERVILRCRNQSKIRTAEMSVRRLLKASQEALKLADMKYLTACDNYEIVLESTKLLRCCWEEYLKKIDGKNANTRFTDLSEEVESTLSNLNSFKNKPGRPPVPKRMQEWFGKLAKAQNNPGSTIELIEKMINLDNK